MSSNYINYSVITCLLLLLTACATLPRVEPVTVEDIVKMSKAGTPPEVIINKIRQSRTTYALTAAQLVKLHEQGVPSSVLDYMQSTYIEEIRREEALRYGPPYYYGPWPHYYGPWPRFGWPYWY